jgi:FkbM family methyltransferase
MSENEKKLRIPPHVCYVAPFCLLTPLLYRFVSYLVRFFLGVTRSVTPAYRLAHDTSEKASIAGFVAKLIVARCLAVTGRVVRSNFLSAHGDRMTGNMGFFLQGTKYFVDLSAGEMFSFEEIYHELTYEKVVEFIPKDNWIIFDVGANVGVFTIQQARRGARVYAFEPNPGCHRRLSKAIVENRLTNRVDVFDWAIGAALGQGSLRVSNGVSCMGFVVPGDDGSSGDAPTVHITPLDNVVPMLGVERIDLLKIDTEGAEVEVLAGAARSLEIVERVIIEYHSAELLRQASDILANHGFAPVLCMPQRPDLDRGILYARRLSA